MPTTLTEKVIFSKAFIEVVTYAVDNYLSVKIIFAFATEDNI